MKTNRPIRLVAALALAALTLASAKDPETKQTKSDKPRLEVCFVLDTTGSMSGLIEGAKQKIWFIANEMISAKPAPEIKLGLVGYRDRGDDYVVKSFDLTNDIDAVYANLRAFSAAGGGDTPESVNEALDAAVNGMKWSQDRGVLKIIFLVGDAPPHMDYVNGPKYPDVCQAAMRKDLIINTVQCGNLTETTPVWKEIAKLSEGCYVAIPQEGGMVAIDTPMDAKLAELNRKVGATLVAYGGETVRREITAKQLASEAAPASVSAERLKFNSASGKTVQGEGELLDSLAAGTLKLDAVKKDQLPADWRQLDDQELKAKVAAKQKEREQLQAQIVNLNRERDEYLAAERQKLAAAGQGDSFDAKVAAAIRTEALRKGIAYGSK